MAFLFPPLHFVPYQHHSLLFSSKFASLFSLLHNLATSYHYFGLPPVVQPLLHIVPFCKGPNKKPERFTKKKQPAIFAMRHASHLVVHHPLLIYNVPYNHRNTFVTYTTNKTLQPAQSPSTLAIFHTSQRLIILKTSHILQYKKYR
jgi:hypothetical protein